MCICTRPPVVFCLSELDVRLRYLFKLLKWKGDLLKGGSWENPRTSRPCREWLLPSVPTGLPARVEILASYLAFSDVVPGRRLGHLPRAWHEWEPRLWAFAGRGGGGTQCFLWCLAGVLCLFSVLLGFLVLVISAERKGLLVRIHCSLIHTNQVWPCLAPGCRLGLYPLVLPDF